MYWPPPSLESVVLAVAPELFKLDSLVWSVINDLISDMPEFPLWGLPSTVETNRFNCIPIPLISAAEGLSCFNKRQQIRFISSELLVGKSSWDERDILSHEP